MTNTVTHTHADDRSELLSGYLDHALDVAEQQQAKRTLADCPACAAELADLRSLQASLRALPAPVPRRSFTIDPATVRPRRLLFPIFRFASLAAALMLVVVLGIDALPRGDGQLAATSATSSSALKEAPAAGGAAESMPEEGFSAQAQNEAATGAPAAALAAPDPAASAAAEAEQPMESMDAPAANALAPSLEQATAAAADGDVPPLADAPAVAGGDVGNAPETLRSSENAVGETEELQAAPPESTTPPINIWQILAFVLALFTVFLGGAWWWTARRGV